MGCKATELKQALNEQLTGTVIEKTYQKELNVLSSLLTPREARFDRDTPVFDSLPAPKSNVKTMVYAGIGSRGKGENGEVDAEVPKEVLTMIARKLANKGYTLRSGGADGSDVAFEMGAGGNKQIFLNSTDWQRKDGSWGQPERVQAGLRDTHNDIVLNDKYPNASRKYVPEESRLKSLEVVQETHPAPDRLKSDFVRGLMARNTMQLFGENLDTPVDFVVAWTPQGNLTGGTAQAIRLALAKGIPVINVGVEGWENQLNEVLGYNKDKIENEVKKVTEPAVGESTKAAAEKMEESVQEAFNFEGLTDSEKTTLGSDIDMINSMEGQGSERLVLDLLNNPGKLAELAKEVAAVDSANGFVNKNEKSLLGLITNITDALAIVNPKIYAEINKEGKANQGAITNVKGSKIAQLTMTMGPGKGNQTGLEVLAEELVHAVTLFGLDLSDPRMNKIMKELYAIRSTFYKEGSAAKLAALMPNKLTAKKDAEELWNYMVGLNKKGDNEERINGIGEFMAKAVTNPYVMELLSSMKTEKAEFVGDTLAARVVRALQKVFRALVAKISKEPKTNDKDRMLWFVDKMAQINKFALDKKKEGAWNRIFKVANRANTSFAEAIDKVRAKGDKLSLPKLKNKDSKLASLIYYGKLIPMTFFNERARNIFGTVLSYGNISPRGTARMIVKDVMDQDAFSDKVEQLGMARQNVDREIMLHEGQHVAALEEGFGRPLTEEEQYTLYKLAKIDPAALERIGTREVPIENLLNQDGVKLDKAIEKLEENLRTNYGVKHTRYFSTMASMLGRFIVTGESNQAMLRNAYAIADMAHLAKNGPSKAPSKELVADIDELASLYAIKNLDKKERRAIKKFITSEDNKEGMEVVGVILASNKKIADDQIFTGTEQYLSTKGYLAEVTPEGVEQIVRPISMKKELEKQGYKLEATLTRTYSIKGKEELMGVYTSRLNLKNNIQGTGFKFTSSMREGATLAEQYRAQEVGAKDLGLIVSHNIRKEKNKSLEIVNSILAGTYVESEKDKGLSPILNEEGKIVDYAIDMDLDFKRNNLGVSTNPLKVLAKSIRNIVDTMEGRKHNKVLVEALKKHEQEFVRDHMVYSPGKELVTNKVTKKTYRLVSSKSTNPQIRELWYTIPRESRKEFAATDDRPEGVYIRETELLDVLGFREYSIADSWLSKKFSPDTRAKIKIAEEIWKNIVALAKVGIVLKFPFVLIDNIISNTATVLMNWHSPKRILQLKMEGVSEINKYMKLHKERIGLEARERVRKITVEEKQKLQMIVEEMKNSPMKPLVDAGFFTQILEETELTEQRGKIAEDWMSEKLETMPGFIKTGVEWAFLTDKNIYHKFMYSATQYSDLAARYASYHLMKEQGEPEAKIQKYLRNAFINYNKPNSALLEWANQMGLVMFTKYYLRIQRFLLVTAKENPLKLLVALGADEVLNDYPDVTDSSIMNKGITSLFYNPLQHAVTAATPGAILFANNVTS